jgi:DNA-directed RNA polymerase specialized sigma24 family protein
MRFSQRAITVNEALGQMRRKKGVVETGEEQVDSIRSPLRDPEQQAIGRQFDGILTAALELLLPAHGEVFRLREMETLSTAETGERLGLTEICVKPGWFGQGVYCGGGSREP